MSNFSEKLVVTGSIVTYNNISSINACIYSILSYTKDINFKLYVFDNGSTDGTQQLIREKYPQVSLRNEKENLGYGKAHNQIMEYPMGKYHFVINPDIVFKENVILKIVQFMEQNPSIQMVTPEIRNFDGTIQYLPKRNPRIRYVIISKLPGFHYLRDQYTRQKEQLAQPTEIEFCTGCFFGIRSHVFQKLSGFDDQFFMYYEDADLSKRVKEQGYHIIYYPLVKVIHQWNRENTSSFRGMKRFIRSMVIYFNKWGWQF